MYNSLFHTTDRDCENYAPKHYSTNIGLLSRLVLYLHDPQSWQLAYGRKGHRCVPILSTSNRILTRGQ